jgi:DNA polymerase-3 subunit gamma/tau
MSAGARSADAPIAAGRMSAAPTDARASGSAPAREALRAALRRPAEQSSPAPEPAGQAAALSAPVDFDGNWPALVSEVRAGGMAAQFLQQSELLDHEALHFRLRVPMRALAEAATVKRAREVLAAHFGREVRLSVEVGAIAGPTAAALASQRRAEEQADARAAIEADPFVQTLLNEFGGTIVPGSVRPAAGNRPSGESNA